MPSKWYYRGLTAIRTSMLAIATITVLAGVALVWQATETHVLSFALVTIVVGFVGVVVALAIPEVVPR